MNKWQKNYFPGLALIGVALVFIAWPNVVNGQSVITKQEASRVLVLENVTAKTGLSPGRFETILRTWFVTYSF